MLNWSSQEGIDLDSFSTMGPPSPTTVLVKNLPYNTSPDTLSAILRPFGDVARLLVPPSGTLAVIELQTEEQARAVYRSLAYQKIGNSVMYVERAPPTIWRGDHVREASKIDLEASLVDQPSTEQDTPGATIFVKNLAFITSNDRLRAAFGHLADFAYARVQTKVSNGHTLSMGYGFVGFRTVNAAKAAMPVIDGCLLDGHALAATFAKRGHDVGHDVIHPERTSRDQSSKVIVKNVPFEASKNDLRQLFGFVRQPRLINPLTSAIQRLWLHQICAIAPQIRPWNSGFCLRRVRQSNRGQECCRCFARYASFRPPPRTRIQ